MRHDYFGHNLSHGEDNSLENREFTEVLPVLPLFSQIIFPDMITSIQIEHDIAPKTLENLKDGDHIALILSKSADHKNITLKDLYRVGVRAKMLNIMRLSDNLYQLYLKGEKRIVVEEFVRERPLIEAKTIAVSEPDFPEETLFHLKEKVAANLEHFVSLAPRVPEESLKLIKLNADSAGKLVDMIAANIPFELQDRQRILEATDLEHRLNIILNLLEDGISNIRVINEISNLAKSELEEQQRKMFLRRQLKTIQKELGEDPEILRQEQLKERVNKVDLPQEARQKAEKELDRLQSMSSQFSEYNIILNYLEWIIDFPWKRTTQDNLDMKSANIVLDQYHYGLEEVKERIMEFLAVRFLRNDVQGPVLCLSGPPGVGKTSLGKAIAKAMGRKFVRMSVGGMRDESEIRGHRRTYVGSMPGRIVQNFKTADCCNPVFMIDEIDKMGSDFRGDPASALLEVLDPEQNNDFMDHYLDLPVDLSRAFFIATANVLPNIPHALRDRLEIIKIPGYTENEKKEIARRHLLPKRIEAAGLTKNDLHITDPALIEVIRNYTREAGVRNLQRELANICGKTAKRIVSGKPGPHKVTVRNLESIMGPPVFREEEANKKDAIGVVTALAWSEAGGATLSVEAVKTKGCGAIKATGQLGNVMKESIEAALTFVKTKAVQLDIHEKMFKSYDVHVHLPAGAVPKDGPSAGLALVTAIASILSDRQVHSSVAMTGEITLTGNVLAIGGLKEKAIAAHRAGIKHVIIPKSNEIDLKEMPDDVKRDVKFHPVGNVKDALLMTLKERTAEVIQNTEI